MSCFFIRAYYVVVAHSSEEKKLKSTFIIIVFLSDERKSLPFTRTKLYTQSKSDVQRNMSFFKVNGPKCQFFLRGDFYLHFLLQKELTR